MSTLSERITARLADLDEEEKRVAKAAAEQTTAIAAKRAALEQAIKLATPEAEAALDLLSKLGVIRAL